MSDQGTWLAADQAALIWSPDDGWGVLLPPHDTSNPPEEFVVLHALLQLVHEREFYDEVLEAAEAAPN